MLKVGVVSNIKANQKCITTITSKSKDNQKIAKQFKKEKKIPETNSTAQLETLQRVFKMLKRNHIFLRELRRQKFAGKSIKSSNFFNFDKKKTDSN